MKRQWLCLAILLVAVAGADVPAVHTHDAPTAGLYNDECPLTRLAVSPWSLPALSVGTLAQPEPAPDPPSPPALAERVGPPTAAFGSRAPPAIS
jgi:hypothetical protein